MPDINTIQDEIIEEFAVLEGDREMTNFYVIDLGETLEELPQRYRNEEHLVKGCQSKVWLGAEMKDGKLNFSADSNTSITKGLVSMLVRVLGGQPPKEILEAELYFPEKIGMERFIGTQRSNGFGAMVKQMKLYALALQSQTS